MATKKIDGAALASNRTAIACAETMSLYVQNRHEFGDGLIAPGQSERPFVPIPGKDDMSQEGGLRLRAVQIQDDGRIGALFTKPGANFEKDDQVVAFGRMKDGKAAFDGMQTTRVGPTVRRSTVVDLPIAFDEHPTEALLARRSKGPTHPSVDKDFAIGVARENLADRAVEPFSVASRYEEGRDRGGPVVHHESSPGSVRPRREPMAHLTASYGKSPVDGSSREPIESFRAPDPRVVTRMERDMSTLEIMGMQLSLSSAMNEFAVSSKQGLRFGERRELDDGGMKRLPSHLAKGPKVADMAQAAWGRMKGALGIGG